ncbi:MAG: alginate lyase family protein [Pyrinomonadaceae bacterium]|nr:alginate lyase family protein [Pyrinomonadaceae bacterium]
MLAKLRRALRGDVKPHVLALEAWRRSRVSLERRRERAMLFELDKAPARLRPEFARLSASELLEHFRQRQSPKFFPGFTSPPEAIAELQRTRFPRETAQLIESGARISQAHRWPVLGFGEKDFGSEIDWRRDLLSGEEWPLDYHAEVELAREGADARVLWELNRLAHFVWLGRAYTVTRDEHLAEEFFAQLESWRTQNPVGRGPNWACAMEVALRAVNLLAAFQLFRHSPRLDENRLLHLLAVFEQHGAHIRRNLEFSYIITSNHYLSDVVGLLWLGTMLPELEAAREWREFGRRELLSEMDKQILADGADSEASTGYHRLVLELFLYSFILCRANDFAIPEKYWRKLHAMLAYLRAYLRPDGRAPLIGDTDSGQLMPLVKRAADEHAYVLALGAAVFKEPRFKLSESEASPEELLWILGAEGMSDYENLQPPEKASSQAFADAGTYIMREGDLYLLFNASDCGLDGRGSHGHNDVLSIEVSACGTSFITDPGTYFYRGNLQERHLFRSTAYHSTVQVDGVEQNDIRSSIPFIIGNEARPRVLGWETSATRDLIIAEHQGYARLAQPVTHRRTVEFDKLNRFWLIEDALLGEGEHVFCFRFHLNQGLETRVRADGIVEVCDKMQDTRLLLTPLDVNHTPDLEACWTSCDYGAKLPSVSVNWTLRAEAPLIARWALVPVCGQDDEMARLEMARQTAGRRANVNL